MARHWRIGFLAALGYSGWKARDVAASLAGLGYEAVEWTQSHFRADMPLAERRELVDLTRDAGLCISRLVADGDPVCLDEAERSRRIGQVTDLIEAAGEAGIRGVGVLPGPACWDPRAPVVGKDISEGAAWDMVFDAFETYGRAAKAAGVTITSEGVFGMLAHDFYSHRHLMSALDPLVHKVNFDPSHGVLYGNLDVGWVVRQWGDAIGHIHLKDAVGIPEQGKFLFPLLGEGNVDWPGFFAALDEAGYDGVCSVEFESFRYYATVLRSNPEAAARVSMEAVRALAGRA